jgi:hypothetical protein
MLQSGLCTSLRFLFAENRVNERYGDFSPVIQTGKGPATHQARTAEQMYRIENARDYDMSRAKLTE